mgnify:FL=1
MGNWIIRASAEGNSPLLPPTDEIIIGLIAFFLIFFVLAKKAFPSIAKTLDARADAIEGGLARASAAQEEATRTLTQYQTQLEQARTEAAEIRTSAQSQGAAIVEEARAKAAEAASAEAARAVAQISAERTAVAASLQKEIGELALTLAGKIVGESLADDAKARATVDRFLDDLEAQAKQVQR